MKIRFHAFHHHSYKRLAKSIIASNLVVILLFAITAALFLSGLQTMAYDTRFIIHVGILGIFAIVLFLIPLYGIYIAWHLTQKKDYRSLGDRLMAFSVLLFPLVPTMPLIALALISGTTLLLGL